MRFGAAPRDIQIVRDWLTARGFRVDSAARGGRALLFSGSVRQAEAAFGTQMRHYNVRGEDHIANAGAISIPSALAPVVKGVASLNDFFSKPVARPAPRSAHPGDTSFGEHTLSPGDFAAIYNLNPLYQSNLDGSGQRIALIERSDFYLSDYADFRTVFGLPASAPNVFYSGADPGFPGGGGIESSDFLEAEFDIQQAGAVARGATIDVVIAGSTVTTDGIPLAALYAVEQNQDSVISLSFLECEQELGLNNRFYLNLWAQAATQGISVIVAAGDTGAAGWISSMRPMSSPIKAWQ